MQDAHDASLEFRKTIKAIADLDLPTRFTRSAIRFFTHSAAHKIFAISARRFIESSTAFVSNGRFELGTTSPTTTRSAACWSSECASSTSQGPKRRRSRHGARRSRTAVVRSCAPPTRTSSRSRFGPRSAATRRHHDDAEVGHEIRVEPTRSLPRAHSRALRSRPLRGVGSSARHRAADVGITASPRTRAGSGASRVPRMELGRLRRRLFATRHDASTRSLIPPLAHSISGRDAVTLRPRHPRVRRTNALRASFRRRRASRPRAYGDAALLSRFPRATREPLRECAAFSRGAPGSSPPAKRIRAIESKKGQSK